jgi:hypothetical protein
MKFWQKSLVVLAAMLIVSFAAGRIWMSVFDFPLPAYLAGLIGGLTAIPVWELMRYFNSYGK